MEHITRPGSPSETCTQCSAGSVQWGDATGAAHKITVSQGNAIASATHTTRARAIASCLAFFRRRNAHRTNGEVRGAANSKVSGRRASVKHDRRRMHPTPELCSDNAWRTASQVLLNSYVALLLDAVSRAHNTRPTTYLQYRSLKLYTCTRRKSTVL